MCIYRLVLLPPPLWYLDLWGIIVCGGFANYYAPDVCVYTGLSFTKNVCVCVTIVIVIVIPSEQWTRNPGHPKTIRKAALLYSR